MHIGPIGLSTGDAPRLINPISPDGRRAVLIAQQQNWTSPYPPPEAAERFEAILPGTFDRILTMVEKGQAEEYAAAFRAQNYALRDTQRGHYLGAAVSVLAMAAALAAAAMGYQLLAAVFVSVPVMAVAKALIETSKASAGPEQSPPPPASQPPPDTPPQP